MKIEENILLQKFTTLRTGGPARYFARVKDLADLKNAVRFAKEKKLPFFVLGKGANVLVLDEGYSGLVIKMEMKGVEIKNTKSSLRRVTASAGDDWDAFVSLTVKQGLVGLENLSLIPGTVGAAVFGNIGAYGRETKDVIFSVEALNTETLRTKKLSRKECAFGYRESFFKTKEGKKYIITRATFSLKKNGRIKTDYKDVQAFFEKEKNFFPSQKEIRDVVIKIRKEKLPDISLVGTAGSFFKNPVMEETKAESLKKQYPDLPIFLQKEGKAKLPAGFLLDKICGFKGYKKGSVGTWGNQALVLVNYGGANAKEILEFAEMMKAGVKEKTGIDLEYEVQMIK